MRSLRGISPKLSMSLFTVSREQPPARRHRIPRLATNEVDGRSACRDDGLSGLSDCDETGPGRAGATHQGAAAHDAARHRGRWSSVGWSGVSSSGGGGARRASGSPACVSSGAPTGARSGWPGRSCVTRSAARCSWSRRSLSAVCSRSSSSWAHLRPIGCCWSPVPPRGTSSPEAWSSPNVRPKHLSPPGWSRAPATARGRSSRSADPEHDARTVGGKA